MKGTWQTTSSGDGWKAAVAVAAVLALSATGPAAAVTGIAGALVSLLCWVAGVVYGTAALAGVAWLATRHARAERRARAEAVIEARRQAREDEIDQRHARRAALAAQAQAQALAPMFAGFTAAMQPQPQPVRVIRAEVER